MSETSPAEVFAAATMTVDESYARRGGDGKIQKWLDRCEDPDLKAVVVERLSNTDMTVSSICRAFAELGFPVSDNAVKHWRTTNGI